MPIVDTVPAETAPTADAQLRRVIGPATIALNAINLTVASAIFALPAAVADGREPYLVVGAMAGG